MSTALILTRPHILVLFLLLSTCLLASTAAAQSQSTSSSTAATSATATQSDDNTTKIHYQWAHGALMSVAFGFFLPVGILFARFFRSPQYSPLWLHLHRLFALIGFALIIAGFAIAVNKFDDDNYSKTENGYHRRAGFYVFAAVCLQVFLGFIRPHTAPPASGEKVSTVRTVWNEVHRWNGRVAYVFALAQIYTGVHILDGGEMTLWIVLFSALWGSLMLAALLLQLIVCVKGSAFGDDGTYTRTTITGNTTEKLKEQHNQPHNDATVKVDNGSSVPAAGAAVVTELPVVQGASITRPVDGSSPELYGTPARNGMTVVQIA